MSTRDQEKQTTMRHSGNYSWLDPVDKLGKGATGVVFKCRNRTSGEIFAVKCYEGTASSSLQREYDVFRTLGIMEHKNIMKMITYERELTSPRKSYVIIMDFCAGGSLSDVLEIPENNCGLTDDEVILFISDVVSAVEYLRRNVIVHRDIKPGNILKYVADDGQTYYRLSDFGAARKASDDTQLTSIHGTDEYLHPAMFEKAYDKHSTRQDSFRLNVKCELWSLGVTVYQIATGMLPFRSFSGRADRSTMLKIVKEKGRRHISGVQDRENGKIVYSEALPASCRLSAAFRQYVTPFIAALLQGESTEMWTFERLFEWAAALRRARFLELFVLSACTFDRVYVDQPAISTASPPWNYANIVREYVEKQYNILEQECDLLVPFSGCSKPTRKLTEILQKQSIVENGLLESVSSQEVEGIMHSCGTVRLRVALADRANRRDATHFVAQLDALKPKSSVRNSCEQENPTPKACAVAIRRIDVDKLISPIDSEPYKEDCRSRLMAANTLRASLDAQIKAIKDGIVLSDRIAGSGSRKDRSGYIEAASRAGFAYTTYRSSVLLADAQALIAAISSHLVTNLKRIILSLNELATSFDSVCEKTVTSINTASSLTDLHLGMLEVFVTRTPLPAQCDMRPLQVRTDEVHRFKKQLLEFRNECSGRRAKVKDFMTKYVEVLILKDEMSRKWQEKLGDSHCFGRVCTFGQFAGKAGKNDYASLSSESMSSVLRDNLAARASINEMSTDVTCWKTLQRNYELCSEIFHTIRHKYVVEHRNTYNNAVLEAVLAEKKLLVNLTDMNTDHVNKHCWRQTEVCYFQFLDWWRLIFNTHRRVDGLRKMIVDSRKRLNEIYRLVEQTFSELSNFDMANFESILRQSQAHQLTPASANVSVQGDIVSILSPGASDDGSQTETSYSEVDNLGRITAQLDVLIAESVHQLESIDSDWNFILGD